MNCSLPKITYPTFRQLLLEKIHKASDSFTDGIVANDAGCTDKNRDFIESTGILNIKDTLKQVRKSTSVGVYRSSIVLRIAAICHIDVTNTAIKITEMLRDPSLVSLSKDAWLEQQLFRDLTVKPLRGSLLELEWGDRAIATWLQMVVHQLEASPGRSFYVDSPSQINASDRQAIFQCQQSYARCTSLLRMAAEAKVLKPTEVQNLPWLMAGERLQFSGESERSLLSEIITVADELNDDREIPSLKLATSLSQQFQAFHRNCRIFGEISTKQRSLAQARLGLVMITHSLLRTVLETKLGVHTPDSL